MPAELIGAERHIFRKAADAARLRYIRKVGSAGMSVDVKRVPVATPGEFSDARYDYADATDAARVSAELRKHSEQWRAEHAATMASKAYAAGMSAVRKMHTARVVALETMSDATRVGGAATGAHLATLTRDAECAAARLEILATVDGKAPSKAKAPARKLASVPDVVAAPVELAEPVAVRKRSRFVSCDAHQSFWQSLTRREMARWFVEGGPNGARGCAGEHLSQCNVWGGTDFYAAASCTVDPIDVGWNKPREIVAAPVETPAPVVASVAPVVDVPARFVCKSCGAESPAGIGYACQTFGPLPAAGAECVGSHVTDPVRIKAPETVPAPMPAMTRAARKASRRELAATMRAAGIKPDGLAWQLARSGVDLADIPAILAGDVAMPESVVAS